MLTLLACAQRFSVPLFVVVVMTDDQMVSSP
jgi:hypothetical protein